MTDQKKTPAPMAVGVEGSEKTFCNAHSSRCPTFPPDENHGTHCHKRSATPARRKPSMHTAIHEAAHAVVAASLGAFAEYITLKSDNEQGNPHCLVSWPAYIDPAMLRERKVLIFAAGPAASAIHMHMGWVTSMLVTGKGDMENMQELGVEGEEMFNAFTQAKRICRQVWPQILEVAQRSLKRGDLLESEIVMAMLEAREVGDE